MCIVTVVARSRISSRSPGQAHVTRHLAPVGELDAPAHVADGLLLRATVRPRDAVIPTPTSASKRAIAPSAMRFGDLGRDGAVALDQRPDRRRAARSFASFEYATTPPGHVLGRSGRSVSRAAIARRCTTRPRAIRLPPSSSATCSSTLAPSVGEEHRAVALGDHGLERARRSPSPLARARITTSSSARRRQVVISSASRPAPRPPRRAASRRSPTRGCRTGAASAARTPCARRSPPRELLARDRRRPHRVELARRAGHHDDGRALPPVRGRHHEPGRRARRVDHERARGDDRLLAVGLPHGIEIQVAPSLHERPRMSAIRSSSASSSTISRPWNRPTTSAVRSSAVGPRPPLVMIRSTPWSGHEPELRLHVGRPVAARSRCGRARCRARAAGRPATGRCGPAPVR